MHVFLYEWATGGGLVGQGGSVPTSLLREGAAMASALAADLVRIENCRITALRDMRVLDLCMPGCDLVDVHSEFERDEQFVRLAAEADGTILIAPEFDQILLSLALAVVEVGGTLLSPAPDFIRAASDKNRTAILLHKADVPTPDAVTLQPDEPMQKDFVYPAVLKPVDGAGSQDTQLVTSPHEQPLVYARPRRLERFCPGLSASVAFLCGPCTRVPLPACRQVISEDGRFRYLGGSLPLAKGLETRATELSELALAALPKCGGYVGVDVILGREPDGSEDVVLDVNPRLTTSYVGLREAITGNLAELMIGCQRGIATEIDFLSQRIEFDTEGHVGFV